MKSSHVELHLRLALFLSLLASVPLFAVTPTLTSISPKSGPINTAITLQVAGANFVSTSQVLVNGNAVPTTYSSASSLQATVPAVSVATPGNWNVSVTTPGSGTSAAVTYTAYLALANNSLAYSSATGLLYASIPSSAGVPYGNYVVGIDPVTGAIAQAFWIGSEPNKLAVSSDGTTLWVGLDGGSAVRVVNLMTGLPGAKFSLGGNSSTNAPPTVLALAALTTTFVVVSSTAPLGSSVVAIYDNGARRLYTWSASSFLARALQVNAATGEVYVGGASYYQPLISSSTGLSVSTTGASGNFTGTTDDMQVVAGKVFTDFGAIYDAESGARIGSLMLNSTTLAVGPTFTDPVLGKTYVFDSPTANKYTQIQVFTTSTTALVATFPLNLSATSTGTPSHLVRWGSNGLAVRDNGAIHIFRSSQVNNLAGASADLSVTLAQSGATTTGTNTTYTATVKNAGPSSATNIALTAQIPATSSLVSITSTAGVCSKLNGISCDLGGMASGGTATVTIVAKQMSAGSAAFSAQVYGSESDSNPANNRASTSAVAITGNTYNAVPTLTSISPAAVQAGSATTMITATGTNFSSAAVISIDGTPLATTVLSRTQATAMVPSSKLASMGWSAIKVSNPTPGGGISLALPLSVFNVLSAGANHIVYEPFSRKLIASIGAGGSGFTANSVLTITPETGAAGTAMLPGAAPTNLALSSDGQVLYATLPSTNSVARFNLLTQKLDFKYSVPMGPSFAGSINLRGISAQPGSENTVALDLGAIDGIGIYDFNPTTNTATARGQNTGYYSGSCVHFLDSKDMLTFDSDTSNATFDHYVLPTIGFSNSNPTQLTTWTLANFGCFQLNGGYVFANRGGFALPLSTSTMEAGIFKPLPNVTTSSSQVVAPDLSVHQVFFLGQTHSLASASEVDGLLVYSQKTFLPSALVPMGMDSIENTMSFSAVDLVRWGQDGLAALTSSGKVYLLRGPVVVPGFLAATHTAATLTSASVPSITHGSGNLLISVVGTNFQDGMAINWNGSYRTTTITDTAHATVAIPASDLASVGTGTLSAVNPGAPASTGLTITIN